MTAKETMDNREKVAKINAELARLELEMELDHVGHLGAERMWKSITEAVGISESDSKKKERLEQIGTAAVSFQDTVLKPAGVRTGEGFKGHVDEDKKKILDKFQGGVKAADLESLNIWSSSLGGRAFYVILRRQAGVSEYSVVSAAKESTKTVASLAYTKVVASGGNLESVVDGLITRILSSIVNHTDLDKFKKK